MREGEDQVRQSSFAAIGDNTIDEYVEGSEVRSYVGGNAVNVAVQLSRLGHGCRYAGAVGDDDRGRRIRSTLATQGVRTDDVILLPGHTSVSRVVVRPNGDRFFESEDFGVCADYRPQPEELDRLSDCAVVHIGMLPDAGPVRQRLAAQGVVVSQDCAVTSGFDHLDVAFCSAGEDLDLARRQANEAVAGGARLAVATCGAEGSVAFDGRSWWRVAASPAAVVDTTGAGDSYAAGFLSRLASGAGIDECMRFGADVAARTCEHLGSWPQETLAIR
jgi:fructoselysine 6-kinase